MSEQGIVPASALDVIVELRREVESLKAQLQRFRQRALGLTRSKRSDHTTACLIWGDDGQGGTAEGFKEPLPCTCGALINFYKSQIAERADYISGMSEMISGDGLLVVKIKRLIEQLEAAQRIPGLPEGRRIVRIEGHNCLPGELRRYAAVLEPQPPTTGEAAPEGLKDTIVLGAGHSPVASGLIKCSGQGESVGVTHKTDTCTKPDTTMKRMWSSFDVQFRPDTAPAPEGETKP